MERVFILSSHPLFGEGVEALLQGDSRLELVGRETDPARAIEQIKTLAPDVVILDIDNANCRSDPMVLRILQECMNVQVIGLNLQDNRICIFHEEERVIRHVDDLRQAIVARPSKSESTAAPDLAQKGETVSHFVLNASNKEVGRFEENEPTCKG